MRIYGVTLKVDVGDELSDKQVEEWIQDALGPAARIDGLTLVGKLSDGEDRTDLLFSMPPGRVTLKDGDVLIFRFKERLANGCYDRLVERVQEVFGNKVKALVLEDGVEMVIGEIIEKEDAGG